MSKTKTKMKPSKMGPERPEPEQTDAELLREVAEAWRSWALQPEQRRGRIEIFRKIDRLLTIADRLDES